MALPLDVVSDIISYLTVADMKIVMLVCHRFFAVIIDQMYSTLNIKGFSARKCLLALNGQNKRSFIYASAPYRLSYTLGGDNAALSLPLLTAALKRMYRLRSLSIDIPTNQEHLLMELLHRDHFIQPKKSILSILHPPSESQNPLTEFAVPKLRFFNVGNSSVLLEAIRHRPLCAIQCTKPLGSEDIETIISPFHCPTSRTTTNTLQDLRVRLQESLDVALAITVFGETFPKITTLSIDQRGMNPFVSSSEIQPSPSLLNFVRMFYPI